MIRDVSSSPSSTNLPLDDIQPEGRDSRISKELRNHLQNVDDQLDVSSSSRSKPNIAVLERLHFVLIVLGDLGRSPRMQYHASSLLQQGHYVTIVGYMGEELIDELQFHGQQNKPLDSTTNLPVTTSAKSSSLSASLTVVRFQVPLPRWLTRLGPLYFVWRMISLSLWTLGALLFRVPTKPRVVDCLLIQNPPALPLMLVSYLYCRIIQAFGSHGGSRPALVIDWHNLGYSMLRDGSKMQKLAAAYERALAPFADGHLTVTAALNDFLLQHMNVPANIPRSVVYDCPPTRFRPLPVAEQHAILQQLDSQLCAACPRSWYENRHDPSNETLLTERVPISSKGTNDGIISNDSNRQSVPMGAKDSNTSTSGDTAESWEYRPRRGRPALVTSSTSWTTDEDFSILLQGLVLMDARIDQEQSTLQVLVVVTGKGPEKAMYQEQLSRLAMQHVAVQTLWLEPIDYPRLLACADVGVSLHTSTSGLDLPMKILDHFGCQVPVVAIHYECLDELLLDKFNGRTFRRDRPQDLADILWECLSPLAEASSSTTTNNNNNSNVSPSNHDFEPLRTYAGTLKHHQRWHDNWANHAWPVLQLATAKARHASMSPRHRRGVDHDSIRYLGSTDSQSTILTDSLKVNIEIENTQHRNGSGHEE